MLAASLALAFGQHSFPVMFLVPTATPILALSANVLPQHIEACLKAGMNDHIGKPINLKELLFKIAWWTTDEARDSAKESSLAALIS